MVTRNIPEKSDIFNNMSLFPSPYNRYGNGNTIPEAAAYQS